MTLVAAGIGNFQIISKPTMSRRLGQTLYVSRFFPNPSVDSSDIFIRLDDDVQNHKRQFQNANNTAVAPTKLKRRQKSDDVCIHDRKFAWSLLYGKCADESQMAICFMCQCSAIGWVNASFHMAHVVPRALCGNNTGVWNRVPVCVTCNVNVESHSNLFDVAMQYFSSRLVPIALYLRHCFKHAYPRISKLYFSDSLEFFVRALFGTLTFENDDDTSNEAEAKNAIEATDFAILMTNELKTFLDAILPDRTTSVKRAGRIQDERVYEALAIYDDLKTQAMNLHQQCTETQTEITRLSANLETKNNLLLQINTKLKAFAPSSQITD